MIFFRQWQCLTPTQKGRCRQPPIPDVSSDVVVLSQSKRLLLVEPGSPLRQPGPPALLFPRAVRRGQPTRSMQMGFPLWKSCSKRACKKTSILYYQYAELQQNTGCVNADAHGPTALGDLLTSLCSVPTTGLIVAMIHKCSQEERLGLLFCPAIVAWEKATQGGLSAGCQAVISMGGSPLPARRCHPQLLSGPCFILEVELLAATLMRHLRLSGLSQFPVGPSANWAVMNV